MQHELGTNQKKSATIRDDSQNFLSPLTTVIKKPIHAWGGGGGGGSVLKWMFLICQL